MKVNCTVCNNEMNLKPSRISRLKNGKITCSLKCSSILRKETMLGENNHQYGLIGDLNASFKRKEIITNYGYILEYCPGHPKPHDKTNKGCRVKQHRLVIERNSHLFDEKYFENIHGHIVLKSIYDVHHKNENKKDNSIDNLEIMTRGEHTSLHNKQRNIIRDSKGRIKGIKNI